MDAAGMSELRLAEEAGIPRSTLRNHLKRGRGYSIEEVIAVAQALGTTASALIATAAEARTASALAGEMLVPPTAVVGGSPASPSSVERLLEHEAVCDSCWSLEDAARHTAGAADETDPAVVRPAALAAADVPVSEEHPVYVWRSDISAMLVWDGVKWAGTGGLTIETQQVGDTGLPYAAPAPNEIMLIKTGRLSSNTTNQFGNGYLPAVKFRAPFPRACLTVTVTPIYRNTKPWFFTDTRAPMIDVIDRTGFRAMYPGETTSVNHSIMWQAIGY